MTGKFLWGLLIVIPVVISVILKFFYKETITSSVWCLNGSQNGKQCRFKNVCYDPELETLLFFLNDETIIKGLGRYKDFQRIQLSSVYSHNRFYANITMIDGTRYRYEKRVVTYEKGLLFSRFKPNNLMHCIHDDLFPLFLTLESACLGDVQCMGEYHLILFDHYPKGPGLYDLFSNYQVAVSNQMETNTIVCFREMLAGLTQDGIFYQYGFDKPQGPVMSNLNQNDVSRFVSFIKTKLDIKNVSRDVLQVVLLRRTKNRRIINVDEVEQMIRSAYENLSIEMTLKTVNLRKTDDVVELIKTATGADVMIGMHGAEMILSLFMKTNSVVFELFPFGITPEAVSFIKAIPQNPNVYFSWRNVDKNNSIAHPDAHPLYGGIDHLDSDTLHKIKTTTNVPPVKCCNDPLYLYHMYQDTIVPKNFKQFLYTSISRSNNKREEKMIDKWFFPHKIIHITCRFQAPEKLLNLTWRPPFNVYSNLEYRLYVKDETGKFDKEFYTKDLYISIHVPNDVYKFRIWISVYYEINDSESSDLYIECF